MMIWLPATMNSNLSTSGAAILLWLGVNWVERKRVQWFLNARTPKTLFRELCRAHGLSHSDRRCLAQIAQPSTSDECCRVFIDPRVIDEFAEANPATANECRHLAQQLFGETSTSPGLFK
jgi:hypothetical protein